MWVCSKRTLVSNAPGETGEKEKMKQNKMPAPRECGRQSTANRAKEREGKMLIVAYFVTRNGKQMADNTFYQK